MLNGYASTGSSTPKSMVEFQLGGRTDNSMPRPLVSAKGRIGNLGIVELGIVAICARRAQQHSKHKYAIIFRAKETSLEGAALTQSGCAEQLFDVCIRTE